MLSNNTTGINLPFDPASGQNPMENITLLKGVRTEMGKYWATYIDADSVDNRDKITYYHIHLHKKDDQADFDLYPNWMAARKGAQTPSANPDKYHYWNRDIFAYINATDNPEQHRDDTISFKSYPLAIHDTMYYSKGFLVLDSVVVNPNYGKFHFSRTDTALMAAVTIVSSDSMRYQANPVFYLHDGMPEFIIDTVFAQNLALRFNRIAEGKKVELGVKESSAMIPFVAMKVLEFPQIGVLWLGAIVMIIGFLMSLAASLRRKLRAV